MTPSALAANRGPDQYLTGRAQELIGSRPAPVFAYAVPMARPASDPVVLRAVAHPLRLAILEEMWDAGRPLRAKDLADILGHPANSISYHVRTLRDAGYVVDVDGPAGSTARDHWYAAPRRGTGAQDSSPSASAINRTRYSQVAEQSMAAQAALEGPMRQASERAQEEAEPGTPFVRYTFLTDLVPQMRGSGVITRDVEDLPQDPEDPGDQDHQDGP